MIFAADESRENGLSASFGDFLSFLPCLYQYRIILVCPMRPARQRAVLYANRTKARPLIEAARESVQRVGIVGQNHAAGLPSNP
jgi:hypothetical protein